MSNLTDSMVNTLEWLGDNGGEGVIDRYGNVIAQGARRGAGYLPAFLRLCATGHVEGAGPNRIRLSAIGLAAAKPKPIPVSESVFAGRRVRAPMLDEKS